MAMRFRRSSRKDRGSRQCGWGVTSGHRKGGSRGGRGNAGGDTHEWQHSIKIGRKFGKDGFTKVLRATPPQQAMNIGDLTAKIDQLLKDGVATKEGREVTIDTRKMGVTKILGRGTAQKMTIIANSFSKSAKEKLEKVGGTAQVP